MWKLVLLAGFLSVAHGTPLQETGITKTNVNLAWTQLREALNQTYQTWFFTASLTNDRIKSMYTKDVRSSYTKLQAEIETVIQNTTDYSISKIIEFLNEAENNRVLLQCIDLKVTLIAIHEAVQNVLSKVHECKWSVMYHISDDLYWTKEAMHLDNSKIPQFEMEASKCIRDMNSTNYPEVFQCLNQVKEKVFRNEESINFLTNHEALYRETLSAHLSVLNKCNKHTDAAEIRKVQDEQFDAIEKCFSDHHHESPNSTTEDNNDLSTEDILTIMKDVRFFIDVIVNRARESLQNREQEVDIRHELAAEKLNLADALDTMQIMENSWKSMSHDNKTLRIILTSEEYSTLFECTKNYTDCSSEISVQVFDITELLGNILDIDVYPELNDYVSHLNEEATECMVNLSNIPNFNDAVRCILRVTGHMSGELTDQLSRQIVADEIMLTTLSKKLSDPQKCSRDFASRFDTFSIKLCFLKKNGKMPKAIFYL